MKIGIIRVGGLGDSIVFSPFLKELRKQYPDDEIILFVQHNFSGEYFSRLKYFDKLEYIDRNSSIIKKIGYFFKFFKRFDLIIDTVNGTKTSCIIANIFGKETIGFAKNGKYNIAIKENEYNHNDFKPLQDLMILKKLKGIDIKKMEIKLDFPLSDEDYKKIHKYNNYCVFHTGGSSQRTGYYSKNLSIKQIESIISFIIKSGYKCIVVGNKEDKEIYEIKDRVNVIKVSDLSIRELGALIEKCSIYVGGNSGPMWIAMALNKKSITISSATSKSWQPLNKHFPNVNNIISSYDNCSMCGLYTCKYNKDKTLQGLCMKNLDLNQIKNFIF